MTQPNNAFITAAIENIRGGELTDHFPITKSAVATLQSSLTADGGFHAEIVLTALLKAIYELEDQLTTVDTLIYEHEGRLNYFDNQ